MPDLEGQSRRPTNEYIEFLDRQAEVFRAQRQTSLARLGLSAGDVVLDAGCGPGTDTMELASLVAPTGRTIGVDSDPGMIEIATARGRARASTAEFVVGDVQALEFESDTFDLVRSVLLLLHVEQPARAVVELTRVLRPDGRLVCIDVDHYMDALDADEPEVAERVLRGGLARLRSPRMGRQLRGLFAAAGLRDIEVEVSTDVHTSWADYTRLSGGARPTTFDRAIAAGAATEEEVARLVAEMRVRDEGGRFFACSVRMRCAGTKEG